MADKYKQDYFIGLIKDEEEKQQAEHNLDQSIKYGYLNSCRRKFLLGYFNEDYSETNCGNCDRCIAFAPLASSTSIKKSSVKPATRKASKTGRAVIGVDDDYDTDLFDVLKQLRLRESKRRRVAPYIVFGDKSLRDMSVNKPQTDDAFLEINGVGDKKLKRFGKMFMDAIKEYEGE